MFELWMLNSVTLDMKLGAFSKKTNPLQRNLPELMTNENFGTVTTLIAFWYNGSVLDL